MNDLLPDRPPPPPFRLPRPRRRPGGVVASVVLHALILLSLVRFGVDWIAGSGDADGPRGGGGGGAGASARYAELPALPAPEPASVTKQTPVVPVPPDPVPVETEAVVPDVPVVPAVSVPAPAAPAAGTGTGGGPGQGPGTGGGAGAGAGGGVGNDSGPGRGGDSAYITPAVLRTFLIPPMCVHGLVTVQFWVQADGRVARVAVDPAPKKSDCHRELVEKMMGYEFLPARTRDGRAVASVFKGTVQH